MKRRRSMADIENPVPKKDDDELAAMVAEPSEHIGFACTWMLFSFAVALILISIGLMAFSQRNYPGTKLDHGASVAGGIGIGVAWACIMLCFFSFTSTIPSSKIQGDVGDS